MNCLLLPSPDQRLAGLAIPKCLLFDAAMLLRGLPAEVPAQKRSELFQHAIRCRTKECRFSGCSEIRSMFASLRAHSSTCVQANCRICTQHQKVRDATCQSCAMPNRLCQAGGSGRRPTVPVTAFPAQVTEFKGDEGSAGLILRAMCRDQN